MRALLLDAARRGDALTRTAADELAAALERRGCEVERVAVRDLDVHSCTGCFGCWTKTPGECVIDDDAREVARAIARSDVFAIATPVSFGGYGSLAKAVLDRSICLILPFFTLVNGEVHHKQRYRHRPALVALGTMPESDAGQAALFARLVERNSVNLGNPSYGAAVVSDLAQIPGAAATLADAAKLREKVPA